MAQSENDICEEIRLLLGKINAAWTGGNPEELAEYFHDDMVISGPGFREAGRGREACVASYRSFTASSRILTFEETDHKIEVWGGVALVSYRYSIDYEFDGEAHRDAGYDVFLFKREGGRWLAVWRALLPAHAEPE